MGVAKLLSEWGADVSQAGANGATALIGACFGGHLEVAELLLEQGANIAQAAKNGMTAFMFACEAGHL